MAVRLGSGTSAPGPSCQRQPVKRRRRLGCLGVGDPACDLVIAWNLLKGEGRDAFRHAVPADAATWARGRGWALWKGLTTLAKQLNTNPLGAGKARRVIDEVLADHKRTTGGEL